MTPFDYAIDSLLVAVVLLQARARTLTLRSLLRPLVLVAIAGTVYLRPISLGGNNLVLIATLTGVGIVLGTLSGTATAVWRQDDNVVSRAGVLAAFLWVLGMGARFAFAIWATHSGAAAIGRFSVRHDITGANIWQVALVLMAFGEVMSRTGVLQFRRTRALNCRNSLGADPDGAGNSRPAYQAA